MRMPAERVDLNYVAQCLGSGHSVPPMLVASQQQAPGMTIGEDLWGACVPGCSLKLCA